MKRFVAISIFAAFVLFAPSARAADVNPTTGSSIATATLDGLKRHLEGMIATIRKEEARVASLRIQHNADGGEGEPEFEAIDLLDHSGRGPLTAAAWTLTDKAEKPIKTYRSTIGTYRTLAPELEHLVQLLWDITSSQTVKMDAFGESFEKYVMALGYFRVRFNTLAWLCETSKAALSGNAPASAHSREDPETGCGELSKD